MAGEEKIAHPAMAEAEKIFSPETATPTVPAGFANAKPGPYTTPLEPGEEKEFQQWVKQNKIPWQDTPTADYDMRGFWKAAKSGDPEAKTAVNAEDGLIHYPDTYKTPYHKTFSRQSKYAEPTAGDWVGDTFVSPQTNREAPLPHKAADEKSKPTESAVKHTAMEAGMHDAAQEKSAKKPAKKMAKHGRPSHTEIEHLEEGGHIIHHRFAHKKGGKSAEPEMQSTHIAADDAGLQAHLADMLSQAPGAPAGGAPMTPPPAAPDAAAAQPAPQQ